MKTLILSSSLSPKSRSFILCLAVNTALSDKSVDIEASIVTAKDTNGAGDMFAGAFMYGLTQGMSDRDAGMLASESAARIVATFGARLPKKLQQDILNKYMTG